MTRHTLLAATLWALALAPNGARADHAAALRRSFQAEHNRQVRAFNQGDIDGFMAHYAPDVQVQPGDGKTYDFAGWKGFIGGIRPLILRVRTHRHAVRQVSPAGADARATIVERESYAIQDTPGLFGKQGARHRLRIDSRYEETWTKTTQGWKVRRMKMLSEKRFIDGHPATEH